MNKHTSSNLSCPQCGQLQHSPVFNRDGYHLVKCASCALIYVNPMPSAAELTAHYQKPEYFAGEESQGYLNYADMKKALLPHFERRIQQITQALPARGRILDFGCAAGYFLEVAKAKGWRISGVELSSDMRASAATSLGIQISASLDASPEQQLDAITLWEVIEHLPEPLTQVQAFYDRLRPGGAIMISTPNNAHWQATRDPNNWVVYRPPSHLIYFTPKTLEDILRRAGFEHISVRGVMPAPPLPQWLNKLSAPIQKGLFNGQARYWAISLFAWRAIRLLGWAWQKIAHPNDDVFTTLEAIAFRS